MKRFLIGIFAVIGGTIIGNILGWMMLCGWGIGEPGDRPVMLETTGGVILSFLQAQAAVIFCQAICKHFSDEDHARNTVIVTGIFVSMAAIAGAVGIGIGVYNQGITREIVFLALNMAASCAPWMYAAWKMKTDNDSFIGRSIS